MKGLTTINKVKKEQVEKRTYLAVDIGASSGRIMKSQRLANGQITIEEIHRFKNGFHQKDGYQRWDMASLVHELLLGLQKVKQLGIKECFIGIDTWGVDYCLLDQSGQLLDEPIAYRDGRTEAAVTNFSKGYSLEKLYQQTGIQVQPFNTIFQLFVEEKERLAAASQLLLIPDYLGYVFTGKAVIEATNASTTQLLNAGTKQWESELLDFLGIDETLFPTLVEPGTILGDLQTAAFPDYDLPNATLITIASHDTASAILGTPGIGDDWAYISSGTWSLLGIETTVTTISAEAFQENYTNEWGAQNTIRFLKNIMGMWLIQEVARHQNYQYSYAELAALAEKEPAFQQFIDVNDPRFLNPGNMITELQAYCRETQQTVPESPGELARCIYDNLALCYSVELEKLAQLTGIERKITTLHVVGGGSNNRLLNQLTADVANVTVKAGPGEATALGNLLMQMIATGELKDIPAARTCIQTSFPTEIYQANPIDSAIKNRYQAFMKRSSL